MAGNRRAEAGQPARPRKPVPVVAIVLVAGLAGAALLLAAVALRHHGTGEAFDLVRWEGEALAGHWAALTGAPLRGPSQADEAVRGYFSAPPGSDERRALENAVEGVIAARVQMVLHDEGLRGRLPFPGGLFPPVAFELAASPRVLVRSPRAEVRLLGTELLSPNLSEEVTAALEHALETGDSGMSVLIVPTGGLAAYPAVVLDQRAYAATVAAVAHEWLHHYLAFYPLGMHYFASGDATTVNETVADLVGAEVTALVVERWGDPTTVPRDGLGEATPAAAAVDIDVTLRDLRREVDALLAAGRVAEAEARMEAVQAELEAAGVPIRRINQAYFAWYGTYAARPDAVDPLGGQLREIRERAGTLEEFVALVRETTSRSDVEALLASLEGSPD